MFKEINNAEQLDFYGSAEGVIPLIIHLCCQQIIRGRVAGRAHFVDEHAVRKAKIKYNFDEYLCVIARYRNSSQTWPTWNFLNRKKLVNKIFKPFILEFVLKFENIYIIQTSEH